MSFFDNPQVRKAVLMTAECGQNYIRTKPVVNIIMGVRSLHTLRSSIDTMGQGKTMDFIV
jgi:hypothetical protein